MRYYEINLVLNENRQQYRQMLQGMVQNGIITQNDADKTSDKIRKILKRQDRISWWLKWFRVITTYDYLKNKLDQEPKDYDVLDHYKSVEDKYKNLFSKITKSNWEDIDGKINTTSWKAYFDVNGANIEHIGGMFEQIPQLDQYQWNMDKSPNQLMNDLRAIERDWQESRKQYVSPQQGDKILKNLVYNNGSQAWVLLDRGGCRDEGDAMGHCGNVPSQRPGDKILSFRTIKGDQHKPHLTFILHKNGLLGEMKGRANNKPNEKYHPYIIDLLKQPFIKGIAGGGYAPQENFEIEDLQKDQMEALLDEKPSLGGPVYMFKKNNRKYSPEIGEALISIINDYKTYVDFNVETGMLIAETYGNIRDIADDLEDNVLSYAAGVIEGDQFFDPYVPDDMVEEKNIINDIYVELDDDTKNKLKKYILNSPDVDEDNKDSPVDAILELIENDDQIRDAFQSGIYSGVEMGTQREIYNSVIDYLNSNGFSNVDDETREKFPKGRKKDEWVLSMNATTILEYMMYGDYDNPEDFENIEWKDIIDIKKMDEPYYGWDGWDEKAAAERTSEELDGILT